MTKGIAYSWESIQSTSDTTARFYQSIPYIIFASSVKWGNPAGYSTPPSGTNSCSSFVSFLPIIVRGLACLPPSLDLLDQRRQANEGKKRLVTFHLKTADARPY